MMDNHCTKFYGFTICKSLEISGKEVVVVETEIHRNEL